MYCRRHGDKPVRDQVLHILHTPGGGLKMEVIYCELCDPERHERILELDAQGLIKRPKRPIY